MKKCTFLFSLLLFPLLVNAQIVFSSCQAPDSVVAKYRKDASRLAVRKFYRRALVYRDSVRIPKTHTDTVLNALVAVYNATSLPARDTVVSLLNIHSFPNPDVNFVSIYADSTISWMQQVKASQTLPTGNVHIDSMANKYHFHFHSYYASHFTAYQGLNLVTDSNCNAWAFAHLFIAVPGVYFAEPGGAIGDGNNIEDSIFADHVQLNYSFGWGDCPAGCIYRRYWRFKVYYDCRVEYVGSYGPNYQLSVPDVRVKKLSVYPNPFNNTIVVKGLSGKFNFAVKDIAGRTVSSGSADDGKIENLGALASGIYLLQVEQDGSSTVIKVFKKD